MSDAHRQSRHVVSAELYRTQLGIARSLLTPQQVADVYRGMPWPKTAGRWVRWDDFVEVHARMRKLPHVTDATVRAAAAGNTSGEVVPRLLGLVSAFADPVTVWRFVAKTTLPRMAPFFEVSVDTFAAGKFVVHLDMPADAQPCRDFFIGSAGAFQHFSELMGFGPATVTPVFESATRTSMQFDCEATRRSRPILSRVGERLGGIRARLAAVSTELGAVETEIAGAIASTRRAELLGELAERSAEQARQSVAAQRATMRMLNHAMRTPLNHIVASASLLQETSVPPHLAAALREIDEHANAILAVIAEFETRKRQTAA